MRYFNILIKQGRKLVQLGASKHLRIRKGKPCTTIIELWSQKRNGWIGFQARETAGLKRALVCFGGQDGV